MTAEAEVPLGTSSDPCSPQPLENCSHSGEDPVRLGEALHSAVMALVIAENQAGDGA